MTPDFDELVGDDLSSEERHRLLRAHELLIAAGPLPELPPSLADPRAPYEETNPFFNRRRNATIAVLAAALAAAAFGIGYLTGGRGGDDFAAQKTIVMHGTSAAPAGAIASVALGAKDDAGNFELLVRASNLEKLDRGAYYTLWLTKKHKAVVSCGSFVVSGDSDSTTEVLFTVSYPLKRFDGWVVTKQKRGEREPTRPLLTSL